MRGGGSSCKLTGRSAPRLERVPEDPCWRVACFQPEGITIGRHTTAYLGSLADGDIYAVSLRTGEYKLISKGLPNSPSVGLKIDNHGRLFVAGGPTGTGRVIDVKTGDIIRNYTFTTEPSFINDVVLTRDYAWFTDSQQPQLYGVPLGRGGTPGGSASVVTLPLTGDWQQVEASTPMALPRRRIARPCWS
jgi:sugar lactone lactonase YvrE